MLLGNQKLHPLLPLGCAHWLEELQRFVQDSVYGWVPLPQDSTKTAVDWINLGKEAGLKLAKAEFLGCSTKCRE
jgi:hypothetical protein